MYTYEQVKESFCSESCILVTKEYIDSKHKLDYVCSEGHYHSVSFNSWVNRGKGCPTCRVIKKRIATFNKLKNDVISEGYEVLTKEEDIKDLSKKLRISIKCSCGYLLHTTITGWYNLKYRCKRCANRKKNKKFRKDFNKIKELIHSENYFVVGEVNYKNNRQKFLVECPKGHLFKTCCYSWGRGNRCPLCADITRNNNRRVYPKKDSDLFKYYKRRVVGLTEINYKKYITLVNPNNYCRGKYDYHLDHIFSIHEGFLNNIPTYIVANPTNLQVIVYHKNLYKNNNCGVTIEELYSHFDNFIKEM